jgi:hypothetical protein
VQDAEKQTSYGTDTTFVSPNGSNTLLRVDVTAHPTEADPMLAARPVIDAVRQGSGYALISLTRGAFEGYPAVHWEFRADFGGMLVQQEDEFFTDTRNGDSIAVLTGAPAGQYDHLAGEFAALRRTLVVR